MFKSLVATCLCALSVNTQPLAPSKAITPDTTFVAGDLYSLEFTTYFGSSSSTYIYLFLNLDSGIDTLKIVSCEFVGDFISSSYIPYFSFDYCAFSISVGDGFSAGSLSILRFDNFDDSLSFDADVYISSDAVYPFTISTYAVFEILEGFEGFSIDALPYLTKIENPYTPPVKSNLYRLLYDFFYSIFSDADLASISSGYNMPFDNWLAHTCTIITLLTLVFVCFLFLKWLFKVISGLILLKH